VVNIIVNNQEKFFASDKGQEEEQTFEEYSH
jgi:hypothetical protein